MFVRKLRNRSGSTSVQIISKDSGKYCVVETLGTSKDSDEIKKLVIEAKDRIDHPAGQSSLFSILSETDIAIKNFVENITNLQIRTIGPELIFGALFDRIGFGIIKDKLFRHIVLARLAYPTSKLKTADYLYRYRGIMVEVEAIYRFLDKLCDKNKETVERVAFEYTKRTLKNISVVFYDMTTLYFVKLCWGCWLDRMAIPLATIHTLQCHLKIFGCCNAEVRGKTLSAIDRSIS
ncbi:hypothetical protein HZC34_03025 [Candidatus Saganbacteria bacterium]|nr:hypothetical protein [Candidatus Saganbacteria bacterium]